MQVRTITTIKISVNFLGAPSKDLRFLQLLQSKYSPTTPNSKSPLVKEAILLLIIFF